jgi:hypothetical protein
MSRCSQKIPVSDDTMRTDTEHSSANQDNTDTEHSSILGYWHFVFERHWHFHTPGDTT